MEKKERLTEGKIYRPCGEPEDVPSRSGANLFTGLQYLEKS